MHVLDMFYAEIMAGRKSRESREFKSAVIQFFVFNVCTIVCQISTQCDIIGL